MTEQHVRKTGSETESEMESIFRNFLREKRMRLIFFFNAKFNVNYKKCLVRQLFV